MRHVWITVGRRGFVALAAATVMVVVAAFAPTPSWAAPASAAPDPYRPPAASNGPSVSNVHAVASHFAPAKDDPAKKAFKPTAVTWPKAGSETLAVETPPVGGKPGPATRGKSTPVTVRGRGPKTGSYVGPSSVRVQVLDRAAAQNAGVSGVVLTVEPSGGSGDVQVDVDYSTFAQAYGGNFGSRLRLVQLPSCSLTTPEVASCRAATPLVSTNSATEQTVSAAVTLASTAVVLAATSDPGSEGSSSGSYAATDLAPSGSWAQGGSTGAFTYSYPIAVPPSSGGLAPTVSVSYNSSTVDGQTAATQAQASWAGNGWSTPQSFIEQTFPSCADDPEGSASPESTSDLCYGGPILTLSLNGSSSALVWDENASVWKAADDGGEVITHVTSSSNGSGTYNTDYWTVTTRDGTVYMFGRNQLPGWSSGKDRTNSVDSVPVFSAHAGDPCYSASGFASSVCTMAYRWNLDYATDVHGNAMSYYYQQDTNYYGQNKGATNVKYVRDSHLDHIDYGFTNGNAYGTIANTVKFNTDDRCVSGTCQPLNDTTKANWPDVPYDLVCASGATCSSWAPSFFSTVRLTSIVTKQYSTTTGQPEVVDSYALNMTMPSGDVGATTLWLSSITRTASGGTGPSITMPPVSFGSIQLANRVENNASGLTGLYKYRLWTITTETGSLITVYYDRPNPCTGPVSQDAATNTKSCFPVRWTPPGLSPIVDWFNKYVVSKVTQTDPTGGGPQLVTSYAYSGEAGWHYDDNEVVKAKYRTYGQFRGYGTVTTYTGDGETDARTKSVTAYYRGMSKNNNTTVVNVTDSLGGNHEDRNELAGRELESTAYLGEGGAVDHSSITSYWVSAATATRDRTGLADLTATAVAPAQTLSRQAVTSTGTTTWRYTETDHTYDTSVTSPTFGLEKRTYVHAVPADAAYDRCTTITYAPVNTAKNLVGLVAEKEEVSVKCGGFTQGSPISVPAGLNTLTAPTATRPAQVTSDVRTFYDDTTWSTTFPQTLAPTKGEVTMVRQAMDYTAGAYTYQTTSRTTHDSFGRVHDAYDGNNNVTTTDYTVNTAGLTTGSTTTNALSQTTSTTVDPRRGSTLTATDLNGVVTTSQYDALGRVTGVWTSSRSVIDPANYTFSYVLANNGVSSTTTKALNETLGYQTTTQIYDALLRSRQTQTVTPQSGRMVTDTFYDSRGWTRATYNGWWDPDTLPNTTLVTAPDLGDLVPNQDFFTYDGLGRTVYDASKKFNVTISTTTTVYNGDRTTVIPPTGGVTQTTIVDPMGRTNAVDQYTVLPTLNTPTNTFTGVFTISAGTAVHSTYGFDAHGNQASTTDAGGAVWTTTFNLLGQPVENNDPDAGVATGSKYDGNGNLVESTDSRGMTVSYTYDALNRKTGMYAAAVTAQASGNQLSKWVYDNSDGVAGVTYALGRQTSSTAYWDGAAYTRQQKGFDIFGNSLGETVTIPSDAEGTVLGTSFAVTHTYSPNTGLLLTDKYPAKWGLPQETVNHGYAGGLDLPNTVVGLSGYAAGTTHDAYGRVNQTEIGSTPNLAYVTYSYDEHTGQLIDRALTRAVTTPTTVDQQHYTRDLAGNITKQVSTRLGDTTTAETQCFGYDTIDRLTAAWTATDGCATTPTTTSHAQVGDPLGAASAYWTTWTIDAVGNRTQQVQHAFTGGPTNDTTTTYTYNGAGAGQPHTLTSTATTGASTTTTSYGYDSAGNMTARNAAQGNQILKWDDAGRLTQITGSTGGPTNYIYDAEGNVLLQKDPGSTVLYLPGQQITLNTTTNTTTGTRYYPLPGGATAVRSGSGTNYKFTLADPHGTGDLLLNNTAQTPTWRQTTPYGAPRGTSTTWPDNRLFLNKPHNTNTGLTEIGARNYDSTTGRFISLDPIFDDEDPQSWSGYAYSNNNPSTYSDPTGLHLTLETGGGGCTQCQAESSKSSGGSWVVSGIWGGIKDFGSSTWGGVKGAFNHITSGYAEAGRMVGDAWNGDWGSALHRGWGLFSSTVTMPYKMVWGVASDVGSTWWNGVKAAANGDFEGMLRAGTKNGLTIGTFFLPAKVPNLGRGMTLAEYADSLRSGATAKAGPHVASGYTSAAGKPYWGHNGPKLPPQPGGTLENALKAAGHHGGCAEVSCLIKAEGAEGAAGVQGGSIGSVRVRGLKSTGTAHGTPIDPCPSCQTLLELLGIQVIKP